MQKSIIASIDKVEGLQIALYLRLSKEDGDKEESDSIKNQRELLLSYIHKNLPGVTVAAEKVDDGFSGATFQRPKDAYVKHRLRKSNRFFEIARKGVLSY